MLFSLVSEHGSECVGANRLRRTFGAKVHISDSYPLYEGAFGCHVTDAYSAIPREAKFDLQGTVFYLPDWVCSLNKI